MPEPVFERLSTLVRDLDEGLQADAHAITTIASAHRSFDSGVVTSPAVRSLLADLATSHQGNGLRAVRLRNAGLELRLVHDDVERCLRLKRARVERGALVVTTSSDSLLTKVGASQQLALELDGCAEATKREMWVMPYLINASTWTFARLAAGRILGTTGLSAPYKLVLGDLVDFPLTSPIPPSFQPDAEDLDLPDEDEGESFGKTGS